MHPINSERVPRDIVVVGASAGGIEAVAELLSGLPIGLPAAVCLVIHRGPSRSNWSAMLGRHSLMKVVEPSNGERLEFGCAYIAPADLHMTVHGGFIFLNHGLKQQHLRPAVNPLFESAALAYGPRVVGAILTGGGSDGTKGLRCIWERGGLCLVQSDPEQPSMPDHALAFDHVSASLDLLQLSHAIEQLARGMELNLEDRTGGRKASGAHHRTCSES